MVEIKYGNQYEVTDIAGQTVNDARERFKSELGIPDKAKAKLNGSKVKPGAELDTVLNDDDKLTFAVSRGKGAYLVGALLLALACTGGIFAATATSDTVTLGVTAGTDLATVTAQAGPSWSVFPRYKGTINAAELFQIDPNASFSGDMLASIYLTNGDDLSRVYNALVMRIKIFDSTGANLTDTSYLTLDSGAISIAFAQSVNTPYSVNVTGGYYSNFRWSSHPAAGVEDPIVFCEVAQASP